MTVSSITRVLPKRQVSWLCGKLSEIPLPRWARPFVQRVFASLAGIDCGEAELPLVEYPSVGAFFSRRLRGGARPIDPALVSCPVDGTLREVGIATHEGTMLVKGHLYSLAELLGDVEIAEAAEGSMCWNLYLSPRDYHRVHAPVDGVLEQIIHIPGALWPVNDWSLRSIPKLFAKNERVVFVFRQEDRKTLLVMVGATNVGSIRLSFDPTFSTTRFWRGWNARPRVTHLHRSFVRGEELAYFALGSSVLLFWHHRSPEQELVSLAEEGAHLSVGLPLVSEDARR